MRKKNREPLAKRIQDRCSFFTLERKSNKTVDFRDCVQLQSLIVVGSVETMTLLQMVVAEVSDIPAANPQRRLPGF